VLLGISSGLMGVYTLLRKRALIGDAIAHAVLPGICIAFMLSGVRNTWVLFAGAVVTGSLAVYLVDLITRRSRLKPDAAFALVLSVFFGAGIFLLTIIQSSGNAAQSGLDKFLFGKAACATAVAANKLGLTGKKINIHFKNGTLHIELAKDKHIIMTGSVSSIKNISLKI
jgi:ABC-type Mn2+/Zn2+ transport system permease subunit